MEDNFVGNEKDILRKVANQILQGTKKKENFKIGDHIIIPQNKTSGIITEFGTNGDVFFETYDRPLGWSIHRTNRDYIVKKRLPKPNKKHKQIHAFLTKYNKKPMRLNKNFMFKNGMEEKMINAGEIMFVHEDERFIDGMLLPSKRGCTPNQARVGLGPDHTVFDLIRCYQLEHKSFFYVPRTSLVPFKWNRNIFKNLQIPDKDRLYTFISQNTNFAKYGVDFHKGQGKSLLLYGDVGCGKTMTVEAISNMVQKPIISVNIEGNQAYWAIKKAFNDAIEYDGIILIDEADLLIADRASDRVQIDAIQTLLKYLEEFKGIIVFTTNFGQNIDTALQNRIDYKIHYRMTSEIRQQIWKKMLPKIQGKFNYDKYSEYDLNGRDIQKCIMFACRKSDLENKKKVPAEYLYDEIENMMRSERVEMFDEANVKYFG